MILAFQLMSEDEICDNVNSEPQQGTSEAEDGDEVEEDTCPVSNLMEAHI